MPFSGHVAPAERHSWVRPSPSSGPIQTIDTPEGCRVGAAEDHGWTFRRVGETEKCPACGVGIDAGAYRCRNCRIYFCFNCRKRVRKGDPQHPCVNHTCPCHGKLLCAGCAVMVPQQQVFTDPGEAGRAPSWAIAAAVVGLLTAGALWRWLYPFQESVGLGGFAGLCVFGYGWWWTASQDAVFFGEPASEQTVASDRRSCIQCRQPVQLL
jgi:hypothetical protein